MPSAAADRNIAPMLVVSVTESITTTLPAPWHIFPTGIISGLCIAPVSYTHLDVYKRQMQETKKISNGGAFFAYSFAQSLLSEIVLVNKLLERKSYFNSIKVLTLNILYAVSYTHLVDMGHARALLSVDNPTDQLKLYTRIIKEGLSVRKVEDLAKAMRVQEEKQPKTCLLYTSRCV